MEKVEGSAVKTRQLAKKIAKNILKKRRLFKGAAVVALSGDLGSGKTTFAQFFAQALGVKEKVVSPTFIILKRFKIYDSRFKNLIHIDAYRVESSKEILELGWKEILENPENIILIEWPEKIKSILPKNCIWVKFKHKSKTTRYLEVLGSSASKCYTDLMASPKKTLVLLDAHAILHRAFHALPPFTSPKGEPTGALYGFVSMIMKIIKELKPDYLAACYDLPHPTFRHEFYKEYKAKRPKVPEEFIPQIKSSKEFLEILGVPIYEKSGFEADDILATIVEKLKSNSRLKAPDSKLKIIIVTGDLDTLQLVRPNVEVLTLRKGMADTVVYNEKAVKERYGFSPELIPDFKGLVGDASDNIIGVAGIGEKSAKFLIKNFGSLENLYQVLEKDEGLLKKQGVSARIIKLLKEGKDQAFFSKALAQTKSDVPVDFSLEESQRKTASFGRKLEDFFRRFGFKRFLGQYVKISSQATNVQNPVSPNLLEHDLKVAFWLLDSRRVNPSLSDIFAYLGTSDLKKAEKKLKEELKKDGLLELFEKIEKPLGVVLREMSERGVLLDVSYLKELSKDYHKKLALLERQIWEMAGEEFNINSPKQLSAVLFEKIGISPKGLRRTASGSFSTRFSELEKIQELHPIIKKIFSYRELAKLTSTYIDNLPRLVEKDGRLHTSFNQTGTTTGRLSSFDPNLQNIPKKSDFGRAVRRAFVAPRGWKLFSFDYSQIELRIAASLSGDKKLKEAFLKGEDIHTKVASEVFNVDEEKVTPEMRRRAKIINFGIIYGMGINSLKKNLGCSKEEAESFYKKYFNNFSGVKNYLEEEKEKARRRGFVETLFKRRRYLPEINSSIDFIRKEAERMAVNAPIQGTAADIIKLAMVQIYKALVKEGFWGKVYLIVQVHDELVFEIKEEENIIKSAVSLIKKIMENKDYLNVPLLVDISSGKNWAEMKKFDF